MKKFGFISMTLASCMTWAHVAPSFSSFDEKSLNRLVKDNKIQELNQLTALLPEEMHLNFVLKHGIKRKGERGHLIEQKVSQSSDPDLPRAILWNESTGFTVSYNGGGSTQKAAQRADVLSYSPETKTFRLSAIDFPLTEEQIRNVQEPVVKEDKSCQECHGPRQRPIFSMYPDWPSFYGSDNDELNNPQVPTQIAELKDYHNFRSNVASHHPRYSPLFETSLVEKTYGMPLWDTYPYRQDTSTEAKNISRSFAFRPGLRLGIVYNRLNAQAIFKTMKEHKNYDKYALLTLHSLLQCTWNPKYPKTRVAVMEMAAKDSPHTPQWVGPNNLQLHYHQIWQLFGLNTNDVDIRYSYNHEGYKNIDASKKLMEPGYIGRYFNSYFDGTATIDELIAAKILMDLTAQYPSLNGSYKLRGLVEKYKHLNARFHYDEAIFKNFDRMGLWFSIPYPQAIFNVHHRETYTQEMKQQHGDVCNKTIELMKEQVIKK